MGSAERPHKYGFAQMWRQGCYKYVYRHPAGPHKLFALQTDPHEESSLSAGSDYQSVVAQLE